MVAAATTEVAITSRWPRLPQTSSEHLVPVVMHFPADPLAVLGRSDSSGAEVHYNAPFSVIIKGGVICRPLQLCEVNGPRFRLRIRRFTCSSTGLCTFLQLWAVMNASDHQGRHQTSASRILFPNVCRYFGAGTRGDDGTEDGGRHLLKISWRSWTPGIVQAVASSHMAPQPANMNSPDQDSDVPCHL